MDKNLREQFKKKNKDKKEQEYQKFKEEEIIKQQNEQFEKYYSKNSVDVYFVYFLTVTAIVFSLSPIIYEFSNIGYQIECSKTSPYRNMIYDHECDFRLVCMIFLSAVITLPIYYLFTNFLKKKYPEMHKYYCFLLFQRNYISQE